MSNPDDPSLLSLQRRDPAAITQIVENYSEVLLRAAWGLGYVGTDAEEMVQEVLVTFLQVAEHFEGRSTVKTFLFGILYNKSLEKKRSQVREQAVDPIDHVFEDRFGFLGIWRTLPRGPEDEALSKELVTNIDSCMSQLTVQQRTAFYLREIEKVSTENLCNILGLTPTHLGVLLFRARNKLRECVEKKWRSIH